MEKLTSFKKALKDNAVAYVKTRLTGRARDYVDEIRNKLQVPIRTESSECITARLLKNKQRHKREIHRRNRRAMTKAKAGIY